MVDTPVLGTGAERRVGSSPTIRTAFFILVYKQNSPDATVKCLTGNKGTRLSTFLKRLHLISNIFADMKSFS